MADETPDITGMSEQDAWEGLEEAYRDGLIDHVPGLGSDVDPAFELNEDGEREAERILRENDGAVFHVLSMALDDADDTTEGLVKIAGFLRDEAGVNAFRVMERHPEACPGIDIENVPEEYIEQFDPPEEDE